MDWKSFNSAPVLPRDRVDTKSAPAAKPVAPKDDVHGEKFARSLSEASPRENVPTKPAPRKPEPTEKPQAPRSAPAQASTQAPSKTEAAAESNQADRAPVVGKKSVVEEKTPTALPKELESLLKTPTSEAGQEALALIANILLQAGPIQENVPVLGVLTGDFTHVSPQDVPEVILNSPFIGKALASDAIGDFLDKKFTIGDLLTSLSIDKPTINGLVKSGVNLEQQVSPRNLLKAIGIDANIVQDELNELRGTLQIEGLRSFMERAKKRVSEATDTVVGVAPQQPLATAVEIPVPTKKDQSAAAKPVNELQKPAPAATDFASQNILPIPEAPLAAPATMKNDPKPQARLVTSSPYEALGDKMSDLATPKTVATPMPAQPMAPVASKKSAMPLSQEEETLTFTPAPLEFAPLPKAAGAPSEGITALGQVLDAKAAKEILAPETTTAEEIPAEQMSFAAPVAEKAPAPARLLSMEDLIARLQKPESHTAVAAPLSSDAIPVTEREEGSSGNSEEKPFDGFTREMDAPAMQHNEKFGFEGLQKQTFAKELLEVAPPTQLNEVRETIHNRVFDNATMMLSEGGGSIRLDLGSKDMGVLDLAVNVQNDQLDLRIIASSENVREILTQDIPRLKDALTQQNLQLRNVEIAVGQAASWAGQSGSGFQDSRQHNPREEKLAEIGRVTSFASRARSYIPSARSALNAHAGRIQVLV